MERVDCFRKFKIRKFTQGKRCLDCKTSKEGQIKSKRDKEFERKPF